MEGQAKHRDPRQAHVPEKVRAILLESRSWKDLHAGLAAEGWKLEIRQRRGQKAGALLLGPNGEKVAAGKADRGATLSRLNSRLSPRASSKSILEKKKKSIRMTKNTERSLEMLLSGLLAATGSTASLNRKKPVVVSTTMRRRGSLTRTVAPALSHLPRIR